MTKCTPNAYLRTEPVTRNTPGARIRNARLRKNMSIADLAKAARLSERTISDIENDKHTPSPRTIKSIAAALNLPIYHAGGYDLLPEDTLGQRIKKARLYHGLTKKELAASIGVDAHTVINWERDSRKPSSASLDKLSRILTVIKDTQ